MNIQFVDARIDLAVKQRRIVQNDGRDDDGDLVYVDGKPHFASKLHEIPEPMATALEVCNVQ